MNVELIADKIIASLKGKTDSYLQDMLREIDKATIAVMKNHPEVDGVLRNGYREDLSITTITKLGGHLVTTIGRVLDDSNNRNTKNIFNRIMFEAKKYLVSKKTVNKDK